MALTKEKKQQVVAEVSDLLANSKLTVISRYQGTGVKALQALRASAKNDGTQIRVIKNRLFKKALAANENLRAVNLEDLTGQLLYAFNDHDEVAPAQNLAAFAKTNPQIEFVVGITADGQRIAAQDVQALANLPSKDQLRAQLAGTIGAPLSGLGNALAAKIRSVFNVLNARATQLEG